MIIDSEVSTELCTYIAMCNDILHKRSTFTSRRSGMNGVRMVLVMKVCNEIGYCIPSKWATFAHF